MMFGNHFVLLGAVLQLLTVLQVEGHGYLAFPKSRNLVANEANEFFCPHCLNGNKVDGVKANDPDGIWNYRETVASSVRRNACGTGTGEPADFSIGGKHYGGGAIQATYKSGGEIDINIWIDTHHHGYMEFYLCNRAELADPINGQITQECLERHRLQRAPSDPSPSPIDPTYPERFYLPPICDTRFFTGGQGMVQMRYLLPNIECEHCVLQWWWISANSCAGPGYYDMTFPNTNTDCNGDGGALGWYPRANALCSENGNYPEEFWNCADIRISAEPGTVVSTSSPAAPVSGTSPPVATAACAQTLATGENCAATPNCCGSGMACYRKNAFWSGCLQTCTTGMTDSFDNLPWECSLASDNEEKNDLLFVIVGAVGLLGTVCFACGVVIRRQHEELALLKNTIEHEKYLQRREQLLNSYFRRFTNRVSTMFYRNDPIHQVQTGGLAQPSYNAQNFYHP